MNTIGRLRSNQYPIKGHNFFVFLTDKRQRIFSSLAHNTQGGVELTANAHAKQVFQVKVRVVDHHDPSNDQACKDYTAEETFEECVSGQLQLMFLPTLG